MCSKTYLILILTGILGLSSCRWVGEDKYQPQTIEIKNQVENCFGDFSQTLENYLKSELQDSEIDTFFGCMQRSIDDFMKKTSERDPSRGYSREEVRGLLQTFMAQNNASETNGERYSRLFLIFKRALIGGDSEYLSRQDWNKVKTVLPIVKQFVIDSKPYTQYYYFYNRLTYQNKRHDIQRINSSHQELERRLNIFLETLKAKGSRLNKLEIQYLIDELVTNGTIKKIEPLLNELIYIFYSFPTSQHQENWSELLKVGEKGLRVMTFVKKSLIQSQSFFMPQGGVGMVALVKSVLDAFEETIKINSNSNLDQELLERFVVSLYESEVFLKNVKDSEDVRNFVSNMGKNLFNSESGQRWYISKAMLNRFKFMYNRWIWSLIYSVENSSEWDLKEKYENLLYTDLDSNNDGNKDGENVYQRITNESAVNLVFPGAEYKMNFRGQNYSSNDDQLIANFYKTMISNVVLFVFDTYGDQSRIDDNSLKHVTEQDSINFYNDIRPVAIAEGLGNPLSCEAGGRTFLEANLFSYSANGNDRIEVQEGVEWVSMAASSASVASRIFTDITKIPDCVLPGSTRFLNKPYLKKECVRAQIVENYQTYFNHMPNLIHFLQTKNMINDFYQNLFEVTRTCADSNLPVSYDEVVYAVTLLGYIEALFDRYDVEKEEYWVYTRPRNETLEMDELTAAFDERFKSILQRIVKQKYDIVLKDSHTRVLFKKLLIYKRIPETPSGSLDGLMWLLKDSGVKVRPLTRIDIYKIFNSILTMNEMPEANARYCRNLSLAWEKYTQQMVFNLDVPENVCESVVPVTRDRRNNTISE